MNIDLDISNYDIPDLEKFLKLPPNYNENDDIITFLNKIKILLKQQLITKK